MPDWSRLQWAPLALGARWWQVEVRRNARHFFSFFSWFSSHEALAVEGQEGDLIFNETCPGFLFTENGEEVEWLSVFGACF